MKLDPSKKYYEQEFGWVGALECKTLGKEEKKIILNRDKLEIIGGVVDDEASYAYDEWALVKLNGDFYLLNTSGCSCPSPAETWSVNIGPATIGEIRGRIQSGEYEGYSLPKTKAGDFFVLLDKAEAGNLEEGQVK